MHNFIAMAKNQVEGLNTTPPLEGSEWAQVLVPCSEEDCPRQVPDPNPKMLTDEEIQMMTMLIERIRDANVKN